MINFMFRCVQEILHSIPAWENEEEEEEIHKVLSCL